MDLSAYFVIFLVILLAILKPTFQISIHDSVISSSQSIHYSPEILKSLRPPSCLSTGYHNTPASPKPRKRGRRGGVRVRFRRRPFKPPLPCFIIGNARSVMNKCDELQANARYLNEYREAGIICITETWLTELSTDQCVNLDGFALFRGDRTANSGKSRGGGVCAYVNTRWCPSHNIHVTHQLCTPNIELLSLSLRPKYLPREFPKVSMNVVYIPPKADKIIASHEIANIIHEQQTKTPDSAIFVAGDFNHCALDDILPTFHQYVTCATRGENKLDLCYGNIDKAYNSRSLPPLGDSDHSMVQLIPKYRCVLKTEKVKTKAIKVWNEENIERLKGCFECTDWSVFKNSCLNVNELNDHVCSYVNFCENLLSEEKEIKLYPNNKPWITKELKGLITEKMQVFRTNDRSKQLEITKNIKNKIRSCKENYRKKLEDIFKSKDSKETWKHLKNIAGCKKERPGLVVENEDCFDYSNKLNSFYARFDMHDLEEERQRQMNDIRNKCTDHEEFVVCESDVERVFAGVNVKKACGPDGMKGFVLNHCASQLSSIFSFIFNLSLKEHTLPTIWKTSEVIPVPKKTHTKELNDFRPVALTPIVTKCLEKLILIEVKKCFSKVQDPMQFAYRGKRGVDDAILVFLENVYKHLEIPKTYCRILFIDFSSAFNTIQPHLIISKLYEMNINKNIIFWIFDFLTCRPQYVKIRNVICKDGDKNVTFVDEMKSNIIYTNTGAPQGAVLSPFLFTAYTNDCHLLEADRASLIKFADDTTIQGLITTNEIEYRKHVSWFVDWCDQHFLLLNVKKTKEMIIDFRNKRDPLEPIFIKNEKVEYVDSYKYLGLTIDNQLNWKDHSNTVYKKLNSRLYFLRKLKKFNVDNTLLKLFYKSIMESIISFSLVCWGGNARKDSKSKIDNIITRAGKICKASLPDFDCIVLLNCQRKILSIIKDMSHPLFDQITFSERSKRPIPIRCKRDRYRNSFLPSSIRLL